MAAEKPRVTIEKGGAMKRKFYVSMVLVLFSIFIVAAECPAACLDPPSGLVSWWPGDGNASDIIGPNDGTLNNGATFASGLVGQAFSLDGVDDEVAASGTYVNYLQQLTIDAWVYHNSLPPNQIMNYVMLDAKAELRYDGISGLEQLHFYLKIDGVLRHIRVSNVLQAQVWHHVAGTYDGSVMRLYLDGAEVGSLMVSGTVEIGAAVTLASAAGPFDGLLDEVEIYYRALSGSEIKAIFDVGNEGKCKPSQKPPPPPVSYDASGTWTYSISNIWVEGPCYYQPEESGTTTITQTGNSVTIVEAGDIYTGEVIEANYTASTSYSHVEGGIVTPIITITLSSGTSGFGTYFWYWDWGDGQNWCRGGFDLSITKQTGGGGAAGGGGGGGCFIGTTTY
jgi:hypothetical protein